MYVKLLSIFSSILYDCINNVSVNSSAVVSFLSTYVFLQPDSISSYFYILVSLCPDVYFFI